MKSAREAFPPLSIVTIPVQKVVTICTEPVAANHLLHALRESKGAKQLRDLFPEHPCVFLVDASLVRFDSGPSPASHFLLKCEGSFTPKELKELQDAFESILRQTDYIGEVTVFVSNPRPGLALA